MVDTQRFFLEIGYDGTAYHGWQVQPNATTVQQILNKALSTLLRQQIETVGCGRTDTGVHATQFFVHFDFLVDSQWSIDHRKVDSQMSIDHGLPAIDHGPSTMDYSSIDHGLPAIDHGPSTMDYSSIDHGLPAIDHGPSTMDYSSIDHGLPAIDHGPSTMDYSSIDHGLPAIDHGPSTMDYSSINHGLPAIDHRLSTMDYSSIDYGQWTIDYKRSLNALLPYDIAVKRLIPVAADAHARFDATQRTYEYHVHFEKDPFLKGRSWLLRDRPDMELMNRAAMILMEYVDFSCFSKSNTQVKTNNCKITRAQWVEQNGGLVFYISADRFLRNMVRAIVGTLLMIGNRNMEPDGIRTVIESKNRSNAGTSVPACGLYLTEVKYPYL